MNRKWFPAITTSAVLALTLLSTSTALASGTATFGLALSSNSIPLGSTFTATFYVTPNYGADLREVSEFIPYTPQWNELISWDNSGSPFDTTVTEGPIGNCLVIDRKSSAGVTSTAILGRATFKALYGGNFIWGSLAFGGDACYPYDEAFLTTGNSVSGINNSDDINFSVIAPSTPSPTPSSGVSGGSSSEPSQTTSLANKSSTQSKASPTSPSTNPSAAPQASKQPNGQPSGTPSENTNSSKTLNKPGHTLVEDAKSSNVGILAIASALILILGGAGYLLFTGNWSRLRKSIARTNKR